MDWGEEYTLGRENRKYSYGWMGEKGLKRETQMQRGRKEGHKGGTSGKDS